MLDERSVQAASTQFNIFKKKENAESMLNESLYQFKFDSTSFQHFFTLSTMLNDLFKRPRRNGSKHEEDCLFDFQTPRSRLEKRGAGEFFLTNFEVFGNRRKHSFECLI